MALNAVTSKMAVSANNHAVVYTCPFDKSHAKVDLDINNNFNGETKVKVAITNKPFTSIVEEDYIIHDLTLSTVDNQANISGVFVGKNEHVYVYVETGACSVRLTGTEEQNSVVIASGLLSSLLVNNNTSFYNFYQANQVNAVSTMGYLTLYNSNTTSVQFSIAISSNTTPLPEDIIYTNTMSPNMTICLNNLLINQSEKIFIKVDNDNLYCMLSGIVVSA